MSTPKILLVEPDPQLVEMLVASLSLRFDAQVTCVSDARRCLDVEMLDPHELVIAEIELADADGLRLARDLTALSGRPIILLAEDPTRDEAIEAMRIGVRELLVKPFAMEQLLDAVHRLVSGYMVRRQHAVKYHRMRDLVRRVIRERRDLNRRVELICRDLVGAHKRLVHRVVSGERPPRQASA